LAAPRPLNAKALDRRMTDSARTPQIRNWTQLLRNAVVCTVGASLFGVGCRDQLPSIYVAPALGIGGFLLMVAGLLFFLLVRGFNTSRVGLPETATLLGVVAGLVIGFSTAETIRTAIWKRDCAAQDLSMACFGLTSEELKSIERSPMPRKNRQILPSRIP
jgi:hypothetical protein